MSNKLSSVSTTVCLYRTMPCTLQCSKAIIKPNMIKFLQAKYKDLKTYVLQCDISNISISLFTI